MEPHAPLPSAPDAERVRGVFRDAEVAARYGRERFPKRRMRRERSTLVRLLRELPDGARIDLACGAGRFGDLVGARGRVHGVDASPAMLREANATSAYRSLVCGDAFRLPFRDRAFAAGVCVRLLQHFDAADRRRVLGELRRVVRGRAVVTFFDAATFEAWRARGRRAAVRSRRAIRFREFAEDCAAAGWRIVRVARKLSRITEHVFVLVEPAPADGRRGA